MKSDKRKVASRWSSQHCGRP